jgi:hypothetical protein
MPCLEVFEADLAIKSKIVKEWPELEPEGMESYLPWWSDPEINAKLDML